jgi:hypothetical protein
LIDPPEFEAELRVIGSNPSEDKILSAAIFRYNNNSYGESFAGLVQTGIVSTKRSTIEVKYSHLKVPLEATIEIHHSEGSSDFHGIFFAHMEYMGEDKIVLLNSSDRNVTVESAGSIPLSRCVVLVNEDAELTLGVKAWQGENGQDIVVRHAEFPAKFHSKSDGEFDVGFCKVCFCFFGQCCCYGRGWEREGRGAAAELQCPRRYSTCGYCSRERGRGPATRAVRGVGNAGRGASLTAGKRECFSF